MRKGKRSSSNRSTPGLEDLYSLLDRRSDSLLVEFGARVVSRLHNHSKVRHLRALAASGNLQVGHHTYGLPSVFVSHPEDRVVIGKFCSIAPQVTMIPGGIHPLGSVSTFPFRKRWGLESLDSSVSRRGDIVVDDDVWIGSRVTLLTGVHLGCGSVIAAGSVVTRDVAPYDIVAGVPARRIGRRFEPQVVNSLLASRWWDMADEELEALLPFLTRDNPSEFLRAVSRTRGKPAE